MRLEDEGTRSGLLDGEGALDPGCSASEGRYERITGLEDEGTRSRSLDHEGALECGFLRLKYI
jgi:hypothetical protein